MPKRKRISGQDSAPRRGRVLRPAVAADSTTAVALKNFEDDTTGSERTGLFHLPREIRDVIYEYSVIYMQNHKGPATCQCAQDRLFVASPHPPYFAHYMEGCLIPDRWLYRVSLVSKQFAAEMRAIFFQKTLFSLDRHARAPFSRRTLRGLPLTFGYEDFIHALGPEADELRRLEIAVLLDAPRAVRRRPSGLIESLWEADAEHELERLRGLLHPNVEILLTMHDYTMHDLSRKQRISHFLCTASKDKKTAFVARELNFDEYSRWWTMNSYDE